MIGKYLITAALCGLAVNATAPAYTAEDLYVLSHIINAEAGDNNCTHEHRVAVGSVVLNRVAADDYPDSIYEVVFDNGQYAPTWDGSYEKEPSADSVEVAKMLLQEGSQLPAECVFQAEFPQGSGTWQTFTTIYGTTYICYR